jgi:transposase
MRQTHTAGERLFVDYAGQTAPVVDEETGEVRPAQIFVAVLGCSNYTYVEATWTQSLPDWTGSHARAFTFFGGCPALVVPDNLASGVSYACFYEPTLNHTYQDLLTHYGTACLPARVRRPRDKAKVETGVLYVERFILARLRNQTFFSLAELNAALAALVGELNERGFQKLPGSRRTEFALLDRPMLRPLPPTPWVYAEWRRAKVGIDYHVDVLGHYYSVPYQLIPQTLDVRVTQTTVEVFRRGRRVASHLRSYRRGGHTTVPEHMPAAHRAYADWTPERFGRWAAETGPETAALVTQILETRPHPQQGFRSCLGLLRLGTRYSPERLEAASARAFALGACSYQSVKSILAAGLDHEPLPTPPPPQLMLVHENLRGPDYYR